MNNTNISLLLGMRHLLDESMSSAKKALIEYLDKNRNSLQRLTVSEIIRHFESEQYSWKEEFTLMLISSLHRNGKVVCSYHLNELNAIGITNIKNKSLQNKIFVEEGDRHTKRQHHLHSLLFENKYEELFKKIEGFMG